MNAYCSTYEPLCAASVRNKKKSLNVHGRQETLELSAEGEGFEPSIPLGGIPVFETGRFNHSRTLPNVVDECVKYTSLPPQVQLRFSRLQWVHDTLKKAIRSEFRVFSLDVLS